MPHHPDSLERYMEMRKSQQQQLSIDVQCNISNWERERERNTEYWQVRYLPLMNDSLGKW